MDTAPGEFLGMSAFRGCHPSHCLIVACCGRYLPIEGGLELGGVVAFESETPVKPLRDRVRLLAQQHANVSA